MPFGSITVNTKTYEPRQPGFYSLSTAVFGDPLNEFRVRGASSSSKDGILRSSVTRVFEKDVTVGSDTMRKQCVVTISIASPTAGFTGAEIDGLASDISEFLTASTISRLMQGES